MHEWMSLTVQWWEYENNIKILKSKDQNFFCNILKFRDKNPGKAVIFLE